MDSSLVFLRPLGLRLKKRQILEVNASRNFLASQDAYLARTRFRSFILLARAVKNLQFVGVGIFVSATRRYLIKNLLFKKSGFSFF